MVLRREGVFRYGVVTAYRWRFWAGIYGAAIRRHLFCFILLNEPSKSGRNFISIRFARFNSSRSSWSLALQTAQCSSIKPHIHARDSTHRLIRQLAQSRPRFDAILWSRAIAHVTFPTAIVNVNEVLQMFFSTLRNAV